LLDRERLPVEVHANFGIPKAFVATARDVSKIWKAFHDAAMDVNATANCVDGLVRHFESCESLVQYENPQRAAITSLEISARCREPYQTGEVSLGGRYSAPVSISLRGEETMVSAIRTTLMDTIDGMKPWYSRVSTIDLFYVWYPIFMVLFLLARTMTPSDTPTPAIPFAKAVVLVAKLLALMATIGGVIWGIAALRKRYFPIATFAIGQGASRHQHNEQVRWVVMVGFLVGVVASIVATMLLAA